MDPVQFLCSHSMQRSDYDCLGINNYVNNTVGRASVGASVGVQPRKTSNENSVEVIMTERRLRGYDMKGIRVLPWCHLRR